MSESSSQQPGGSEAALEAARREKLHKIREMGVDPWGSRFDGHQPIGDIRGREGEIVIQPAETAEPGHSPEQHGPTVRAAGRIVLRRPSGKVHWLQVRDWSGTIQVMLGKAQIGEANFALAQCLDLGDIVGVDGELKRTMKGELTIFATGLTVLSKSLATPPEKHKGLADPELRQRMRYLDLIHTDGVMETFLRRTKIVQSIRNTLAGRGFAEVEGPMLHAIAGGAAARPFITHHNALDIDIYLRIALELHLKRLLVGGIERVYELGRVFRNEGIDARHNPEFTMLEVYQAYGNYETMMELTEALVVDAIRASQGSGQGSDGSGAELGTGRSGLGATRDDPTSPAPRPGCRRPLLTPGARRRSISRRRLCERPMTSCLPITPAWPATMRRASRDWPKRSVSIRPASIPTW